MFRKYLQPKLLLKKAVAAVLMLSLSGAYCLFCCQEIGAAMAKAEAEHCPLRKTKQSEHCNFSKKNKDSEISNEVSSANAFECCGLKFNFFVAKLEKNENSQNSPALANKFFNFLQSVKLENKTSFTDFSYRVPILENRDLHIKNCVFRI